MSPSAKSLFIIAATLIVGGLVGAFTTAAVNNHRMEQLGAMRYQEGFIHAAEAVIVPTDEAQRERLRPVLQHAAARRAALWHTYRTERRVLLDSMREELAPLLTEEQRQRLRRWCGGDPKGPSK